MALRIAVVGSGFGARIQVPGLRASGRFEVVALVARDARRTREAAARLGVPLACTSLEEALATGELDAVSIATPPTTHAPLVIAAARRGMHVLVEKPMARNGAEAAAMLDAARQGGVVGMIDFEFRFHPARAMLRRLVARGDLGEPRLLIAVDTLALYADPYKPPPGWWYDADAGGGWLGASGSHLVDATRMWLGEVASVTALVETLGRGSADDTYAILARLQSGARAVLTHPMGTLKKTAVAAMLGTTILMTPAMADAYGRRYRPVYGHRNYYTPPALIGLGIAGAVLGTIAVVDSIVRPPFLYAAPPPPPSYYDQGYRRGYYDGRRDSYDDGYRSLRYDD